MICSTLMSVSIMTGLCTSAVPQGATGKPPTFSITVARNMINAHRARYGLNPLAIDSRLSAAARSHSRDLARRNAMSHRGSDGSYPKDRARRAGYNPRLASENVAVGWSSTADVIGIWKGSSGHNANLLRRGARHMGMAMVYNPRTGKKTFWTLVIGKPR